MGSTSHGLVARTFNVFGFPSPFSQSCLTRTDFRLFQASIYRAGLEQDCLLPARTSPRFPLVSSPEDQPEDDGNDAEGAGGETGGGGEGGGGAQKENMKPCQFCRRPFRKERIAKHEGACKKQTKAIGACWLPNTGLVTLQWSLMGGVSADTACVVSRNGEKQTKLTGVSNNKQRSHSFAAQRADKAKRARNAVAKMAPRPPRNLKVIAKTCDQVWRSDAPLSEAACCCTTQLPHLHSGLVPR